LLLLPDRDRRRRAREPKRTCIAWHTYLTHEAIAPLKNVERAVLASAPALSEGTDSVAKDGASLFERLRSSRAADSLRAGGTARQVSPPQTSSAAVQPSTAAERSGAQAGLPASRRPDDGAPPPHKVPDPRAMPDLGHAKQSAPRGLPHTPTGQAERGVAADRAAQGDVTVPAHPRAPASATSPPGGEPHIGRHHDTSATDTPKDYLELAQRWGFVVAARYVTEKAPGQEETLWVLHHPRDGILLELLVDGSKILDATMHYNIRADDQSALAAAFPEHKDVDSRTLYAKESCVEGLIAKCRRLRRTQRLQREWKVSPAIYLLTPHDWKSSVWDYEDTLDGAAALNALNSDRLAGLPEEVRRQTGLGRRVDPGTATAYPA
jgi:hypothetical protein